LCLLTNVAVNQAEVVLAGLSPLGGRPGSKRAQLTARDCGAIKFFMRLLFPALEIYRILRGKKKVAEGLEEFYRSACIYANLFFVRLGTKIDYTDIPPGARIKVFLSSLGN